MRQMAGAILFEAVDRCGGTKSLRGVTNSWNDVEEAYRFCEPRRCVTVSANGVAG